MVMGGIPHCLTSVIVACQNGTKIKFTVLKWGTLKTIQIENKQTKGTRLKKKKKEGDT